MIKAVVLDVDGVIVGDREGVNFPYPGEHVIKSLKKVRESGVYVVLCTGRAGFGIEKIVRDANLDNLHISDGGAVALDPLDNSIAFQHLLDNNIVLQLANFYLKHNIYIEFFSSLDYFALKSHEIEFIRIRSKILQRKPLIYSALEGILDGNNLIKVLLWTKDGKEKEFIDTSFKDKFGEKLNLNWTMNPSLPDWSIGLITVKGISKRKGVEDVIKSLGVSPEDVLGMGDTMHDWDFIEICGYGATLADADEKLKELVLKKEHGFVGRSVNEDGVLDILRHFELEK